MCLSFPLHLHITYLYIFLTNHASLSILLSYQFIILKKTISFGFLSILFVSYMVVVCSYLCYFPTQFSLLLFHYILPEFLSKYLTHQIFSTVFKNINFLQFMLLAVSHKLWYIVFTWFHSLFYFKILKFSKYPNLKWIMFRNVIIMFRNCWD